MLLDPAQSFNASNVEANAPEYVFTLFLALLLSALQPVNIPAESY